MEKHGKRNERMTQKKAKLAGTTPSRWSQETMKNITFTRTSSQIILVSGDLIFERPYFR
jgi:hypothetical protein